MASCGKAFVLVVLAAKLGLASSLFFDAAAAKEHPVSRVVALLKDMKQDLEKEADADEEVYEKLACWCQTNDKSKTKAISDAEARIKDLDAKVEKMAALSQTLQVEIQGLEKEIAADQKSLATATAMREKEASEFVGEEKEMIESIRALQAAVVVISKQHGGKSAAFLHNPIVNNAFATAKLLMEKHFQLLQGVITPRQRRVLASFVQSQDHTAANPATQAYQPQSGEIFGILKQMKETFESNLSSSQKEELAAQETFKNLKKAKEEEIQAGQESAEAKKQQLASTDETLAQSKEDREDTYASLGADKKFLMEVKVKCKMTDKEWEERQKLRQSELQAVAKAIEILSSDEARDQFSKTFNPKAAFLQVKQEAQHGRAQAAQLLSRVAPKNPKITALAVAVRLDPFPKVKKAIDDMVASLLKEKAEEIKEKKFCTEEFHSNDKSRAEKGHTKGKLNHKIAALEQTIKEQTSAIKTLENEMTELDTQLKKASDDRVAEKKEFELLVADQKTTEKLLHEALTALREVYGSAALVQQNPPAEFGKYQKSRASSGIIAMIEQIITDTQLMTKEAIKAEQNAIDTYTKFKQTTNEGKKAKDDAKVDLESQRAQSEKDLTAAKTDLKGTSGEIEALEKSAGDLHKQCDFLLKNFEVTQKARDEEVEALKQAKAFISGMKTN